MEPIQESARVSIIGGGLMGAGIAQCFASAGHRVTVQDPDAAIRTTLIDRVADGMRQVKADPAGVDRIRVVADLAEAVHDAAFVTEAAPERLPLKRAIFADLVRHTACDAILATNTSVMPVGSIAEGLDTADRIVGTHWWNPAVLIPLVEVVQGPATSDATIATTMGLLASIGKRPAHVRKDVAGFVGNRLQHALWREAIAMVADGVCDAATIDACVRDSFGLRLAVLGPLENADLVGIPLTRDIHRIVIPELNRDGGPHPLLDEMIDAGRLGFSTGGGFRSWSEAEQAEVRCRLVEHLLAARRAEEGKE